jgi:predicted TIM-barrel fold metal-dependent hydrolase
MREEAVEEVIEPGLPIIDTHHHLWHLPPPSGEAGGSEMARRIAPVFARFPRYAFDELSADLRSGHDVRATVAVEGHNMYRADGPAELRSTGEVEFLNGVAAIAATGLFGQARPCAGIVGNVDLTLGDRVEEVLDAHVRAGGGRYRGVRPPGTAYDPDPVILGSGAGEPHRLLDPQFQAGARRLGARGLSLDLWIYEPQLPDLIAFAPKAQDTQVILDHFSSPLGVASYAGRLPERFPIWRENIRALARMPNVAVKLGAFGQPMRGFTYDTAGPLSSEALARTWTPWIETCVEAFGAERCMFESNFPIDWVTCSYRLLWNAYKRAVSGASPQEKAALFHGAAARIYRLDLDL